MELNSIQIFQTIIGTGVTTTITTNILNSPLVKIPFQRNKRLTAFGVSVIATFVALYQQGVRDFSADWQCNVAILLGVFITSAITYNNISK
jgi:uncharacterized membrane protein (DUF441 family)